MFVLSTPGSTQRDSRNVYGILGIEPGLAVCKANARSAVLALQPHPACISWCGISSKERTSLPTFLATPVHACVAFWAMEEVLYRNFVMILSRFCPADGMWLV